MSACTAATIASSGIGQRVTYPGSWANPPVRSTAHAPPGNSASSSATSSRAIAGSSGEASITDSVCRSHSIAPLLQIATL